MKVKSIQTAVVFLLSIFASSLCVYALDDILIEPPLTWSVNSIRIVWTVTQGRERTVESRLLYEAKVKSNPLSLFGLHVSDANASVYEDDKFNYNQSDQQTDENQWSESEKDVVRQVLAEAFESNDRQTASNQRLVFAVTFVNHAKTQLKFDNNQRTNFIPVFLGQTITGIASPVGIENVTIFIPATGAPTTVYFEMPLEQRHKTALMDNKPLIRFTLGQVSIRTPSSGPVIFRESLYTAKCFTVAVLSDNAVKEWKIRYSKKNPVTLRKALEAINENIRKHNADVKSPLFEIKDDHLVSVCGAPFTDKDAPDWTTKLKVYKNGSFQTCSNPDSSLTKKPRSGERYVFQLENQEIKNLKTKADKRDVDAIGKLAVKYFDGDGVPEDQAKAVELWRKAAESGHAESLFYLGSCYFDGVGGVPENKEEAVKLWLKSAQKGYAMAQYNLGNSYIHGDGVPEDKEEAVKWWLKAAQQGCEMAEYNLGNSYFNGEGVPEDKKAAIEWWFKSAQKGYPLAQYNLGICYSNGKGVPVDKEEAVKWWLKAAQKGLAAAQFNLASCYFKGEGVPKDEAEAIKWTHRAAESGDAKAQVVLGYCYYHGELVPKNIKEAIKWWSKAAQQGDENAIEALKQLAE